MLGPGVAARASASGSPIKLRSWISVSTLATGMLRRDDGIRLRNVFVIRGGPCQLVTQSSVCEAALHSQEVCLILIDVLESLCQF